MPDLDEYDDQLVTILTRLGGVLLSEETVDRILQLVTELTERTVRDACAVSVTLSRDGAPYTSNASDDVARDLDQVQYATEDGPCLEAMSVQAVVNTELEEGGYRWPAFSAAALRHGIGGIISVPLTVPGRSLGALNIYSRKGGLFDPREVATTSLLAQQASAVLANAVAFADVHAVNGQLTEALATRDLIGQAKGILMARQGSTAEEAFDVLRRASQRTNRKLRDVAAEVVANSDRARPL